MMCAAHTGDLQAAMDAGFKSAFVYRAGEIDPTVPSRKKVRGADSSTRNF
ncbi:MAG: hypothetical protein ACJ0BB_03345 [Dehalococcoidia bacterium]